MRVLVTAEQIRDRIRELGAAIGRDYPDGVLLVAILKGACFFLADLARAITCPVRLDFIGISSYGKSKTSSGEVKLTKDLDTAIDGADVLLVEDIVDSGRTLAHVLQMLKTREPKSLKVCVLLDKKYRREVPVEVDYVGFDVPDKYVFGYGIDIDEHYRNLRFIASADMQKYKKMD